MTTYKKFDLNNVANIPDCLKHGHNWVLWREEEKEDGSKPAKVPYNPHTLDEAEADNPSTWSTFDEALQTYKACANSFAGIGREFQPDDAIVGIDFDKCIIDGKCTGVAQEWLPKLNSYTETSPSGTGYKVWLRGRKPGTECRNDKVHVEIYDAKRYFTVTGERVPQYCANVESRQSELEALYRVVFGKKETAHGVAKATASQDVFEGCSALSDDEILTQARGAKNGQKFCALFDAGDTSQHGDDDSRADLALCSMLAFWTRKDAAQIDRLFRRSALMREKWERADYRDATIAKAVEAQTETYDPHTRIDGAVRRRSCEGTTDDNVRGEIVKILTSEASKVAKAERIARLVADALNARGQFYYHADSKTFATAMYFDKATKTLQRIQADSFLSMVADWTSINRSNPIFAYIKSEIETESLRGKTRGIRPEVFWASRPSALYLSCGDGQLVRITPNKVEVLDNGTDGVLFQAGNTLPPWQLVEPQDPFESCGLFRGASFVSRHAATVFKLWTLSLATNPTSKPPTVLSGSIGSGKTKTIQAVCEMYGLPFAYSKADDGREADFWTAVDAGGLFTLDNVDTRIDWIPDAVAAATTGVGQVRRKLYSDRENVALKPNAWLCLTSSNPTFAADAGLADRLLVCRMNRRDGETQDGCLFTEIAANRSAALTWIANTLATALADKGNTPKGLNKRHPDFAAFAVRLGRAMGCEQEAIAALESAEADKSRYCLENDSVGQALLTMMEHGQQFTGTAAGLLARLATCDDDFKPADEKRFGKFVWTPRKLGKALSRLWTHVANVFDATQEKDRNGIMVYHLRGLRGFKSHVDPKSYTKTSEGVYPDNVVKMPLSSLSTFFASSSSSASSPRTSGMSR